MPPRKTPEPSWLQPNFFEKLGIPTLDAHAYSAACNHEDIRACDVPLMNNDHWAEIGLRPHQASRIIDLYSTTGTSKKRKLHFAELEDIRSLNKSRQKVLEQAEEDYAREWRAQTQADSELAAVEAAVQYLQAEVTVLREDNQALLASAAGLEVTSSLGYSRDPVDEVPPIEKPRPTSAAAGARQAPAGARQAPAVARQAPAVARQAPAGKRAPVKREEPVALVINAEELDGDNGDDGAAEGEQPSRRPTSLKKKQFVTGLPSLRDRFADQEELDLMMLTRLHLRTRPNPPADRSVEGGPCLVCNVGRAIKWRGRDSTLCNSCYVLNLKVRNSYEPHERAQALRDKFPDIPRELVSGLAPATPQKAGKRARTATGAAAASSGAPTQGQGPGIAAPAPAALPGKRTKGTPAKGGRFSPAAAATARTAQTKDQGPAPAADAAPPGNGRTRRAAARPKN